MLINWRLGTYCITFRRKGCYIRSKCIYTADFSAFPDFPSFQWRIPWLAAQRERSALHTSRQQEKRGKSENNSPVIRPYAPVSYFLLLLGRADPSVWEFYMYDILYATVINQSYTGYLCWAPHLSSRKETSLWLLTKFLFFKFLFGGESVLREFFRSFGWVQGVLIILQGVVQAHVACCAEYWSYDLHATPDVRGSLFDLQAVGGWQNHSFSSFVWAGCSWQTWPLGNCSGNPLFTHMDSNLGDATGCH